MQYNQGHGTLMIGLNHKDNVKNQDIHVLMLTFPMLKNVGSEVIQHA